MTEDIRPTTLKGIKRMAKKLAKEQDIKHSYALELAAKAAGFNSYHLARRGLQPEQEGASQ